MRVWTNCSAQALARVAARAAFASVIVMSAMSELPLEPTLTRERSSSAWLAGRPATRATRSATSLETTSLMLVAASRSGSPLPERTGEPKIARSSSAVRNSTLAVAA